MKSRLTLKRLKVIDENSHETYCFYADLALDGKKIGSVSNEGQGGCNNYHFKERKDKIIVEAIAEAYVREHGLMEGFSNKLIIECSLEHMIDYLIDYKLSTDELKKAMRSYLILKNSDCPKGEFMRYSKKTYGVTEKNLNKKCTELASADFNKGKNPKILNGMGWDEAYKLWHYETTIKFEGGDLELNEEASSY